MVVGEESKNWAKYGLVKSKTQIEELIARVDAQR